MPADINKMSDNKSNMCILVHPMLCIVTHRQVNAINISFGIPGHFSERAVADMAKLGMSLCPD